jgi:hypothetical protein
MWQTSRPQRSAVFARAWLPAHFSIAIPPVGSGVAGVGGPDPRMSAAEVKSRCAQVLAAVICVPSRT